MDALSDVLRGLQLAIVPEVEAYWIENPVPAHKIKHITPSGWIATVDGQHLNPLHFTPEQPPTTIDRRYSLYLDPIPDTPEQPTKARRHSRKGEATGWIEERQGNKHRKHPSTSYYYRYYDSDGRKQQQYVQVHLMGQIRQMIDQRCTVEIVLKYIHTHTRRKEPKL
jgi:hypothetical protein